MSQRFEIPADFRAFMREVANKIEWEDREDLTGAEALQHECGRGGLYPDNKFRFTYIEKGGHARYQIELREAQIRDIALGVLHAVDAIRVADGTRATQGEALLVWGEFDDDALRVRNPADLAVALDALHAISSIMPLIARLWSNGDDQALIALNGSDCAIYVVQSVTGYGRTVGDPTRGASLAIPDHRAGSIEIDWADMVPWQTARQALLHFAERGELGNTVICDDSIPTQFLVLGDYDREAELASRRPPPTDLALSSIPRRAPQGEWARRLVNSLLQLHLLEVDMQVIEAVIARVAILLIERGDDALDKPEAAAALAKDLERVRGVGALFATGGDLQIALRRTQDAPTSPVDVPFA